MIQALLYSNFIKLASNKVAFVIKVFIRACYITIRWDRRLHQNYLRFSTRYNFDNSLFILEFDFKNVLYYKISNIYKSHTDKNIVFNLNNYPEKNIQFVIVGLFRKKVIIIPIKVNNHLVSIKTKAAFSKPTQAKFSFTEIKLKEKNINIKTTNPQLVYTKNTLSINSPFNQNHFI